MCPSSVFLYFVLPDQCPRESGDGTGQSFFLFILSGSFLCKNRLDWFFSVL